MEENQSPKIPNLLWPVSSSPIRSYLISLGLHYLVYKLGMSTVITSQSCEESSL